MKFGHLIEYDLMASSFGILQKFESDIGVIKTIGKPVCICEYPSKLELAVLALLIFRFVNWFHFAICLILLKNNEKEGFFLKLATICKRNIKLAFSLSMVCPFLRRLNFNLAVFRH